MIRRPPRSTQSRSSAASDVYKRQEITVDEAYEMIKNGVKINPLTEVLPPGQELKPENKDRFYETIKEWQIELDK